MVISTATSIVLLISNIIGAAMQSLFGYILQFKSSTHIINFLPFLSKNPLLDSLTLLPMAFLISLILVFYLNLIRRGINNTATLSDEPILNIKLI